MFRLLNLPLLERLTLSRADDFSLWVSASSLGKLPSSLTSLDFNMSHKPLNASEIKDLPPTLKLFQVRAFDLSLADLFVSHCSNCHLSIDGDVDPWGIPHKVLQSTQHWLPHYHLRHLEAALIKHYQRMKIHLKPHWEQNNTVRWHDRVEEILGLPVANAEHRASFTSELKSVTILRTDFTPQIDKLPPGLTAISIERTSANLSAWPFTSLTHLDVPLTLIKREFWPYLANLALLKAHFADLEDFNVEPFLTRILSRKTRANASITLSILITGVLLPEDEVEGVKDVNWSLIHEMSRSILTQLLASPMPALTASPTSDDAYHTDNDTIGRVVSNIIYSRLVIFTSLPLPLLHAYRSHSWIGV